MPLSVGDKLGPYQILSPLGTGGMGEVYKARDTRLDRSVAIKVLPEHIAKREDARRRFEREARAVASLNHPNICVLHDIGSQGATGYMVMEYLEGETLATRIERGAFPLDEALKFAVQTADALDRAHRAGVTHRDVKPANIMLTRDGVKVLDFGLAKAGSAAAGRTSEETLTKALTVEGTVLGTPQYMAPELFAGKEADARADIWAFGAVLYEMVSGRKAFEGKSYTSLVGAILASEPPQMTVKPFTPAWLERLVRRCLAKEPDDRYQSMRDVVLDLRTPFAQETATVPGRTSRGPWAVAAVLLVALGIALWALWRPEKPADRPLVRLDVDLGSEYSGADVILSPDGARLVFVSKGRLFTRRLNQSKAAELAGTEGAYSPFFSPDGQWVAFFGGGKLKRISVEGGAVIALCDAPRGRGGAWGEDHTIIATLNPGRSALSRIPDAGGAPQPLTELAPGEVMHRWPQILPGGKAVLFTNLAAAPGSDGASIEVMSLPDRRRKTLHRGGTYGRYLPTSDGTGHLVYNNKGTLFAVPFDPNTLEVRGTPVPVVQEVSYSPASGYALFDFSWEGTLVYRSGGAGGMLTLQWLDGAARLQSLPAKPGAYGQPRFSPDGKLVALTVASGDGSDIWTYDWQRDTLSKLTFGDGICAFPVWSPDSRYLVFRAASGISWTRADGAGKPQPLTRSKTGQFPGSFSPDGKRLAYFEAGSGGFDLWTVPVETESGGLRAGKPEVYLQTPVNEQSPAFSPDGRWIAYDSIESGTSEIYVRAFPDKGGKWQISNSGGVLAIWSRNGHELFYRTRDQEIMVVSYTTKGDSFVPDKPRLWSSTRLADAGYLENLDLSPDGKRFLVLMPAEAPGQPRVNSHVTFLLNFFGEVRRRTAGGK